jgi:hypothetical protein
MTQTSTSPRQAEQDRELRLRLFSAEERAFSEV